MPSRREGAPWALVAGLAALFAFTQPACAALPVATGQPPTTQQVDEALVQLQADPNLPHEQTIQRLAWKDKDRPDPPGEVPAWFKWFESLFSWIATSARLLMWVTLGILAAMLGVFLYRLLRRERMPPIGKVESFPTHVRDLDIREASLPDDIGLAARTLWDSGEQRAALALLYRGLLSRLVHRYQAPVRESTTEEGSLALARHCLPDAGARFAQELIGTWQRAVYADRMPSVEHVHALCTDFTASLDVPR